ncbi:uncharacterized protein LOC112552550 [Pogonomyrmex barbatus]|uniref:Uncharacterized protein LOC112552550 n=1 Tax=Pogonomyrmex barbatus TaxID=144034 RepID=A0A8N1S4W4_9HYME|nr:uncharacterized protein LOC112552550 [Pogonomyrmex barbatus]
MTDKQLQRYRRYQSFLRRMLVICGCWHTSTKSGKTTQYYSFIVLILLVMFITIKLHILYQFRHNLVHLMKNLSLLMISLGSILKVSCFLINRRFLIAYHRTLNNLFEKELSQSEKVRTVMLSPLRTIATLAYAYSAIVITLSMTYFLPTYIIIIRGMIHLHIPSNYTLPYTRGHGYGYFWTVPPGILRHLHMFFESYLTVINSTTCTGVDSVFGFYIYLLTSTMRAMTFKLTNPSPNDKFYDVLKINVAKHKKLMQCRDILTRVYSPIILWHIITNAVFLCSLIFDAVKVCKK